MDCKFSSDKTKSGLSSQYFCKDESNVSLFETYEPTPPDSESSSNESENQTDRKAFCLYLEDTIRNAEL